MNNLYSHFPSNEIKGAIKRHKKSKLRISLELARKWSGVVIVVGVLITLAIIYA